MNKLPTSARDNFDPYGDSDKTRPSFPGRFMLKSEMTGKQSDNNTWLDRETENELTYAELLKICATRNSVENTFTK